MFSSKYLTSKVHGLDAVREGFRDDKEQFLVDFEQKKWDGASVDEDNGGSGLEALLASPAVARGAMGDEAAEEARRLEESVRKDLGAAAAEGAAKSGAEALQAKRREAARRRMQAAAAAAGGGPGRAAPPPKP
jgi:hypothetical protein